MIVLDDTEMAIILMISKGINSEKMANRLHVSLGTIKYRKRILLKGFKAKNEAHLMRRAFQEGILKLQRS